MPPVAVNPSIPIEDDFTDVLGKAMRGLDLNAEGLAARSGVRIEIVRDLLSGQIHEASIRHVAKSLGLSADCILELATKPSLPQVELPAGVELHNTAFPVPGYASMTVNSYSIHPSHDEKEACLIDAGSTYELLLESSGKLSGKWLLLLTHTHPDHVIHYKKLSWIVTETYTSREEPIGNALFLKEGDAFDINSWKLTAMETPGHSPGGMSYYLEGPDQPVLFVGDAIFCYSIGKVNASYPEALNTIREKILSLPDNTILCPGHGPITSVGFEKSHNPFFAQAEFDRITDKAMI